MPTPHNSPSARTLDTAAAKALSKHLEKGATGRLSVSTSAGTAGSGAVEVSVYVQQGVVLAAEGTDDSHHFVRRLRVVDAISGQRTMDLLSKVVKKEPIFGELIDGRLPSEVLDPIFTDRFRDNLARFLGCDDKARFAFTAGVFVDNLQMGHDTSTLISEAAAMWQASATVPLDLELAPGPTPPAEPREKSLVDALRQARVVTPLLARLPMEPIAGRAFLAGLLSRRVLRLASEPLPHTDIRNVAKSISPDEERTANDDALENVDDVPTSLTRPPVRRMASDVDDVDLGPDDEPVSDAPSESVTDGPSASERTDDPTSSGGFDQADEQTAETEVVRMTGGPPLKDAGDLSSLSAWMEGTAEVEEDLEAFADHDENRGVATGAQPKGAKGSFSTEQHNLDRVEVSDDLAPARPAPVALEGTQESPLEVGEVERAQFAAPTLTEEEATEKLAVVNEVLMHIVKAIDGHGGAGAGIAALQLMLEGAPARFLPIFEGATVEDEDLVSAETVFGNLATRPPSEHRRLLNDGLADLIDRALSHAADELTDDALIDAMLEATAGYRGRLGL